MVLWQSGKVSMSVPWLMTTNTVTLLLVRGSLTSAHACPPLTSSSSVRALRTGWQRRVQSAPLSHCSLATNRWTRRACTSARWSPMLLSLSTVFCKPAQYNVLPENGSFLSYWKINNKPHRNLNLFLRQTYLLHYYKRGDSPVHQYTLLILGAI